MKTTLLAGLFFAFSGLLTRDELRYEPEQETTLTHTFLALSETKLVGATLEVDGEVVQEADEEQLEGAFQRESLERIQVSDEITSVEDGRATEFRRTFVELVQERDESSGENELSTASKSDLEGISVDFSWDEDAESYDTSFSDEKCSVDKALLEHLDQDVDFAALLPEDEVQPGEEWEVDDAAAYLPLMWPSGLLGFYDEDQEGFDEDERAGNLAIIESLRVSCQVTYEGEEERDGSRVALLSVSMQIEGERENEIEPEEGPAYTVSIEIERSLEGEVLWDLEHKHLYSASFEGNVKSSLVKSALLENPDTGEEFDVRDTKLFEGTITYTVSVERE